MPRKSNAAVQLVPSEKQPLSRVTRSLKPVAAQEKDASGHYRMIHGAMVIPIPEEDRLRADGSLDETKPRTMRATIHVVKNPTTGQPVMETYVDDVGSRVTRPKYVGDEVWLNHDDAKDALARGMVEPLDASPSKCGKKFAPPKETMNWAQSTEAAQLHAPVL